MFLFVLLKKFFGHSSNLGLFEEKTSIRIDVASIRIDSAIFLRRFFEPIDVLSIRIDVLSIRIDPVNSY